MTKKENNLSSVVERKRERKKERFPSEEEVAMVMRSLYRTATEYFNEKGVSPKVVVTSHYSDGKISEIFFEELDAKTARELSEKIIGLRPHAWGHLETFADTENLKGSTIKLFADLAYPTFRAS